MVMFIIIFLLALSLVSSDFLIRVKYLAIDLTSIFLFLDTLGAVSFFLNIFQQKSTNLLC